VVGVLNRLRESSDVARLARFFDEQADPWLCLEMPVPAQSFGQDSHRQFSEYLEGPSRVRLNSVAEVCEWLRGCEAIDDQALFCQADFWQHPVTFEQLRRGDCEDHSLWAWRQLLQLGLQARFVAGLWRDVPHTWVLFDNHGAEWLIETTAKTGEMIHPVAAIRHFYCPALAVAGGNRTFVYKGYPRFCTSMARWSPIR
jgi:hypothetical protein